MFCWHSLQLRYWPKVYLVKGRSVTSARLFFTIFTITWGSGNQMQLNFEKNAPNSQLNQTCFYCLLPLVAPFDLVFWNFSGRCFQDWTFYLAWSIFNIPFIKMNSEINFSYIYFCLIIKVKVYLEEMFVWINQDWNILFPKLLCSGWKKISKNNCLKYFIT